MRVPELVLVTLTNGDVAFFVNADAVMTLEASDRGSDPGVVARSVAKALGVELRSVSMDQPKEEDWSWNDVYADLPKSGESSAPAGRPFKPR